MKVIDIAQSDIQELKDSLHHIELNRDDRIVLTFAQMQAIAVVLSHQSQYASELREKLA